MINLSLNLMAIIGYCFVISWICRFPTVRNSISSGFQRWVRGPKTAHKIVGYENNITDRGAAPCGLRLVQNKTNTMSDKARANLNTSLLWAILVTVATCVYQAGRVYNRIEVFEREIARVRPLEEDVIKIKARLNMASAEKKDSYGINGK